MKSVGFVMTNCDFVHCSQRLNVSITRARFALWIVGHVPTLQTDSEWSRLIRFANEKGCVLNVGVP
jgi:senataxin